MPFTVAAIAGGVKLGSDVIRGIRADKERGRLQGQLDELSKTPIPQYMVSPELRAMYSQASSESMNPQGFSGAETAGFNQRLGNIQNTQYNNAVNRSGGQMGRFIGGVLNTQATNASNQFAAQGEQFRRMNRQSALGRQASASSQIQNVGNMNTAAQLQRRMMIEQALGRSIAMQKQNIDNAWGGMGDLAGNVDWRVLEFDHVKGEKKFDLANGASQSYESLKKEISKCEIVCANCHRIRTIKQFGYYKFEM